MKINVSLTNREIQICYHSYRGMQAKEIAQKLGLSSRTIEDHLANAKKKYGVDNKIKLIQKFYVDYLGGMHVPYF